MITLKCYWAGLQFSIVVVARHVQKTANTVLPQPSDGMIHQVPTLRFFLADLQDGALPVP